MRSPKPGSAGSASTKRLLVELRDLSSKSTTDSDIFLKLGPVNEEDLSVWEAVLKGPKGTAYEGGLWKLSIKVPTTYPTSPPTFTFVTKICHPNVNFKTGEICLDVLKSEWSSVFTISTALEQIQSLLVYPEPDSPLNVDIAVLMRAGDTIGAESLVRFYTRLERWDGS